LPINRGKNIIAWFLRPFKPQTKQYWRIVLLCFVAASTFWLLNALNKSYSTQTTYPVEFVYNKDRLIPVKPLPEEVIINVTGKGWKLLRKSLRLEVQPAEIYIRSLPRNNYLLGSALRPSLVNALDGLQLNFVATDTLYFNFDKRISKTVAVRLDPKQRVADNRFAMVGRAKVKPDSIQFRGPSSLLDSIPNPYYVRLPEQLLSASASIEVPIEYNNKPLVKSNVEKVVIDVKIKPLVQEERQVIPESVNIPRGRNVSIYPPSILVRYQVLEDSLALLNKDAFKVILNMSTLNPMDTTVVPELVQKPAGTRNVTIWPDRVKVLFGNR
jgi:hypothetical protein